MVNSRQKTPGQNEERRQMLLENVTELNCECLKRKTKSSPGEQKYIMPVSLTE